MSNNSNSEATVAQGYHKWIQPGLFVLKLFLIWFSWKIFIWFIGEESVPLNQRYSPLLSGWWEQLNDLLRIVILVPSELLLNILGYQTELVNDYVLRVQGYGGIALGNYCLGFQLMYYYVMLMVISGITVKKKIFGIITGLFIVQVLNIFRVAGLNLIDVHAKHLMWISHDYIFNFIVFGILLLFYYKLLK